MKEMRIAGLGFMFLLMGACGQTERTEATVAEIEAAQMEGRNVAKDFVSRDLSDTMKMQRHILEAKSRQSKYLIDKKPECAAAFDSAFVSTLRTVRPDIADEIARKVL